ncbi:MAG: hypothetical protein GXY54_07335 [Deltaproteobacteria bacterium]|nr:hypothetical protein [Deltaproteobacteria bacterium]
MLPDFDRLACEWEGGPYVARSQVREFSSGMLHPRTMANYDCLGEGPPKVKFGKKVFYLVEDLVQWMKERATRGA